eukprot:2519946-Amphidinium_carterae.1
MLTRLPFLPAKAARPPQSHRPWRLAMAGDALCLVKLSWKKLSTIDCLPATKQPGWPTVSACSNMMAQLAQLEEGSLFYRLNHSCRLCTPKQGSHVAMAPITKSTQGQSAVSRVTTDLGQDGRLHASSVPSRSFDRLQV